MLTMELKALFCDLSGRLSPENLTCDGELSRSQVNARRKAILKEWAAAEKQAGCKVTEDETWAWWDEVNTWRRDRERAELAAQPQYPNLECAKPGVYRRKGARLTPYYVWTPLHCGSDYQVYSEFAYTMRQREKLGTFGTMEEAIAAAEAFLRTVNLETLRAALPQWREEYLVRELETRMPEDILRG